MHKFSLSLAFLFSLIILASCGGGSDGSDGADAPVPQEEEDTGGTSGGSGGGSTCLSTSQRTNITHMLDSLSADSPMTGDTIAIIYNDDGTVSTGTFPATAFSFGRANANSWGIGYAICTSPTECRSAASTAVFRNGCFYVNDDQARIISTSSSRVSYSTFENGLRFQSTLTLSSLGIFRYTETNSVNGRRTLLLTFVEHSASLDGRKGNLDKKFKNSLLDSLKPIGNEPSRIKDALPLE